MAETATSTALVIGGRYLASPAALRARPEGPIDALDTSSGRAAQVRILFASEGWEEDAFAEAVSRWCALACSEICGVLDFGDHEGRRFLVVPPSLGMSVERWQLTRRPGPADAARLTLAFGRLAERIAAAGFPVDACNLGDCAVGPGPTPFIERPLIGSPVVNDVLVGPRDGQRTLASILRAAAGGPPPEPLGRWLETAAQAGFGSLTECLDELERCGNEVRPGDDQELLGIDGLFDEDDAAFEARLLGPEPRRWPRRLLGGLGAVAAALLLLVALDHRGAGAPAAAPVQAAPRPVAVAPSRHPNHHAPRHEHPRRGHPRAHARLPKARPASSAAATPPPPSTATPPPPTSGGTSAGTPLPDPGSVSTLPPP
ncbi:MAG TPA: hypothetical protein VFH74_10600 [Gaiellales bacterium]|nr:hypothetical protein [Gaiellales bacterium]